MELPGWAMELVKYGGLPTLLFLVIVLIVRYWWKNREIEAAGVTEKRKAETVARESEDSREQWKAMLHLQESQFKLLLESAEAQRLRDHELLREMIETVDMHTAAITRVEQKISSGIGCKIDLLNKTADKLAQERK